LKEAWVIRGSLRFCRVGQVNSFFCAAEDYFRGWPVAAAKVSANSTRREFELMTRMTSSNQAVAITQAEIFGDMHPLLEQVGAAESMAVADVATSALAFAAVRDVPALRRFLDSYRTQVLFPAELPVIVAAHGHATRGEVRELIALDRRIAAESPVREFAAASCRVGRRQLSKLRALRDHRVVQRYLAAIEGGAAHGWHTLVYGVSLAVFSVPLRQGLQNYAEQTMAGFVHSAAGALRMAEAECDALINAQAAQVPRGIEGALLPQGLLLV
jgi:urease accessory protein UreF